jgi:hypothetical protein
MKRTTLLLMVAMVIGSLGIAGTAVANGMGPAPNAGDGIPDGSGNDAPYGAGNGPGPAPNAGDGISDGSGWV